METVLFLAIAFAVGYVVVYTPVSGLLGLAEPDSSKDSSSRSDDNNTINKLAIPEDSTLKRHFFSQLRTDVESELAPRPTCSMLKRHHDALVLDEMDSRLQAA